MLGTHDMLTGMAPVYYDEQQRQCTRDIFNPRISAAPPYSLDGARNPFYNGASIRPKLDAERRTRFC